MAKVKTSYICCECGSESPKWYGRCPDCGSWNSMTEQVKAAAAAAASPAARSIGGTASLIQSIGEIDPTGQSRHLTGMEELDRVLGGGLVIGSVVLLAGDPGIGKSTLLLQICGTLGVENKVLYVTGEESAAQIKLRASRLAVENVQLYVAALTDIQSVLETIAVNQPDITIIDSIQTMNLATLSSSSGSVTQVRECTQLLIAAAKSSGMPLFIVGHVNKDGGIAGPRVLEHMVDAVLYFEGERHLSYRILRAVKNRYGSTNEIGVFEMTGQGLEQISNPSLAMISGRPRGVSGTCIACVMEGSRPILTEVQALVAKSAFAAPRRTATGFDYNRLTLLLAVLEKRCGFGFSVLDAYLNVVGGLRIDEPAADLPVALALVSNLLDKPIGEGITAFGEVGLAGEIRGISHIQTRIKEAHRLGMTRCIVPKSNLASLGKDVPPGLEIIGVRSLNEAFKVL